MISIATQHKCMALLPRRWPIPDMISIAHCTMHQNTLYGGSPLVRFNWDISMVAAWYIHKPRASLPCMVFTE